MKGIFPTFRRTNHKTLGAERCGTDSFLDPFQILVLWITLRSSLLGGFIFHRGGAKTAGRICSRGVL
ncbi:MAG: hypothetical protein DME19_06755 [Verrucomicrobia bacterium]|nr:MAG: hypothetical protein DME19_06755 [Verrucomicrobiota bacterium]